MSPYCAVSLDPSFPAEFHYEPEAAVINPFM